MIYLDLFNFFTRQILFQNLIHVEKHYLLASLRIFYAKSAADEVSEEHELEFSIEVELLGGNNKWRDYLKLPYRDFLDKVKDIKTTLKEFMINSGFLAKQRRILADYFRRFITVDESKIIFKPPLQEARSLLIPANNANPNNQRTQFLELKGSTSTTDDFFAKLFKIQSFWEEQDYLPVEPELYSSQATVKVVADYEPNFGASENIDQGQQLLGMESKMQYYNSLKYLKPRRYYIQIDQILDHITIRLDYADNAKESSMHVVLYHQIKGTVDLINLKNKKTQVLKICLVVLLMF